MNTRGSRPAASMRLLRTFVLIATNAVSAKTTHHQLSAGVPCLGIPLLPASEIAGGHEINLKRWNRDHYKFLLDDGSYLKLGDTAAVKEMVYYHMAVHAGFAEEVMPHIRGVAVTCGQATLQQFIANRHGARRPSYQNATIGLLSDAVNITKLPADACWNISDPRAAKVMVLDYMVGYTDRNANCMASEGGVAAIDQDSGPEFKGWNPHKKNGFQWQVLRDMLGVAAPEEEESYTPTGSDFAHKKPDPLSVTQVCSALLRHNALPPRKMNAARKAPQNPSFNALKVFERVAQDCPAAAFLPLARRLLGFAHWRHSGLLDICERHL